MNKLWITRKSNNPDWETDRLIAECLKLNISTTLAISSQIDVIANRDDRSSIRVDGCKTSLPNIVLSRTGSGTCYFSLAILRQLERCGVTVLNSSTSIENVKDKLHSHQILAQHGIAIPKTMLCKHPVNIELVADQIKFPIVIKVISGSYGKGVHLCQDQNSFKDMLELIESLSSGTHLLFQEYVQTKVGEDLRVLVVGDKCLGAILRKNIDGGFKANISRGGEASIYPLTPEIEEIASRSSKALGLEIAGVDLLFDKDGYKICELNSAPGFKGFEQAHELNVAKEIVSYCISKQG